MRKLRSILAASDFSEDAAKAARRASRLALELDAAFRLLHVVRADRLNELRERLHLSRDLQKESLDEASRKLDALAADTRSRTAGPKAQCVTRAGNVLDEVLAEADHADVLVLGAHGLSAARDLLIGTTAERLLRRSRRPMIVVREEPRSPYRKVFVAVDFSVHSIAAFLFAQEIAPQAEFHAFHACEFPNDTALYRAEGSGQNVHQYQVRYRDQALVNMENFLERAAAPRAQTSSSVEDGNPKLLTCIAASAWDADLIVLGKHGHSLVDEFLIGGVTRHTVSRASCDVAVVPDWPRL